METKSLAAHEKIDDLINQLLQLEYEDNQEKPNRTSEIRNARTRAGQSRSISLFWDKDAKDSRDPSYQRICTMEANYFRERAELEEAHATRCVEFEDKRTQLRQRRSELLDALFALRDKASANHQ